MPKRVNPAAKATYHCRGCGLTQVAMSPIESTTDPRVWAPPMAGGWGSTCGRPPGPCVSWSTTPVAIRSRPLRLRPRHGRVRVADGHQVARPRRGFQLGQSAVGRRLGLPDVDPALAVGQVAKNDRPGRAGRLARGHDLPVPDRPADTLGLDLGGPDALHAVGALFHHPPLADGDLR